MSNFTDVDALAAEPGVVVRFVDRPEELADADLVVVPGTRGTVRALAWLRERGLAADWPAGPPRGARCSGSAAASSCSASTSRTTSSRRPGAVPGLGLLPVRVRFARREDPGAGRSARPSANASRGTRSTTAWPKSWAASRSLDGCRDRRRCWGTHWHGSLESDGFRRPVPERGRAGRGPPLRAGARHLVRRAARGAARPARRPDRGTRGHRRPVAADRAGPARRTALHPAGGAMTAPASPWRTALLEGEIST